MLYSEWQQKLLDKKLEVTDLKKYIKNFLPKLHKASKKGYVINTIIPAMFVKDSKLFYITFKKEWDEIIRLCEEADIHMIQGNMTGYVVERAKVIKRISEMSVAMETRIP